MQNYYKKEIYKLIMKVCEILKSKDNITTKIIQQSNDALFCESVYVNHHNKQIICFSTQFGCTIGCRMCFNGINKKFHRNLTKQEIVDQIFNCMKVNKINEKPFLFSAMGIGEPLLNLQNFTIAIKEIVKIFPSARFAIATCVPQIDLLEKFLSKLKKISNLKITISLHAPNDQIRNKIIPIKSVVVKMVRKIAVLSKKYNREFEFNYLLLENINDSDENAAELSKLISKDYVIKINNFNKVAGCEISPSKNKEKFVSILKHAGNTVEEYSTDGQDINAACGQLGSRYAIK